MLAEVNNVIHLITLISTFHIPHHVKQGQKEIAACTELRFFPLFATNFMYSLMYSLLKIAVSRILAKIIAKSFCREVYLQLSRFLLVLFVEAGPMPTVLYTCYLIVIRYFISSL